MNERLFLELKRHGLHQYELAGRVRISETYLTRILYGRVKPSDDIKHRIARALGLSVEELFGADGGDSVPAPHRIVSGGIET